MRTFSIFWRLARNFLAQLAIISLLSEQFIFVFTATAHAADLPITPDGSTNTQIDRAANGVPIVNIAAPNAGGLSHNKFESYNVNPQGLILNNAIGNQNGIVQTQTGGLINDNANLKNSGAASVILNEVTSNNISQINGYTEIAGKKADLVLANPNGFVMNGAGFINVSRFTAVVGSSNQFNPNPGDLTFRLSDNAYAVTHGFLPKLTIMGAGIDLENITSTDLVANVMNIVAPVYGGTNDVNLRTGDQAFNYLTKAVTSDNTTPGSNLPDEVAIDASALGKIQAGRIFIVATKEGFGIKWSGDLLAQRDGIVLDNQGNIDYNNAASEVGNIEVTSHKGSITQNGISQTKDAGSDIKLNAFGNITNSGQFVSARNINIDSGATFRNQSSSVNLSDNDFTIKAVDFTNLGQIAANRDLSIEATATLTNSNALVGGRNLTLTAPQITNEDSIYANNKITITATDFLTNNKDIVSLGTAIDDGITINAKTLNNNQRIAARKNITINSNTLNNNTADSIILALNDINLNTTSLDNSNANIQALNNFTLRNLKLNSPDIAALFSVTNEATSITNTSGSFFAGRNLDFDLGNLANYTITGTLESAGNIKIKANTITNQASVKSNGYIKVEANNTFTNGSLGGDNSNVKLIAGTYLDITAQNLLSNYGTLSSKTDLKLTSTFGNINNNANAEIIGGTGKLTLSAKNGTVNQNSLHSIVANGDYSLDVVDFVNTGRVDVAGNLTLNVANNLTNEATAMIYAGGAMTLNVVNNLTNNSGAAIFSEGNLTIQKRGLTDPLYDVANNKINQLDNISGEIISYAGNLTINALTLNNKRAVTVTDKIVLPPSSTNPLITTTSGGPWVKGAEWCGGNYCGAWRYIYVATITANSDSTPAKIQSGGSLTLNVGELKNEVSEIYGDTGITLNASKLDNSSTTTMVGRIVSVLGHDYSEIYDTTGYSNLNDRSDYENYRFPKMDRNNLPTFLAVLKSGGSIGGTVTNDISNTTKIEGSDEDVRNKSSQLVNSINVADLTRNGSLTIDITGYLNGPDNQGLFTKNPNPNGPLFETRSQFLDQSRFFGSDYFYTRIGLNLTDVQTEFELTSKRLVGDQFFQTKIIEEQLRTITKNSYLLSASETNVNNEIKSLLDNAADEYTRLGLTTNTSLTQAQINSLNKDIIWFETQTIDGATYIVPKIYLTQTTRDNLANGSLANKSTIFAKDNITLTSTSGKITNDGSIIANNVTLSASSDILNKNFSNITALNALSITSSAGSISNFSQLKAGGALSLTAAQNITNSATVLTNAKNLLDSGNVGYTSNGETSRDYGRIISTTLETAGITAGTLTATAGNDFKNQAANITTTGNATITAGDDISFDTLKLRNRTEESWGSKRNGGTTVTDNTTNISSSVNSSGNLTLTTNATGTDNEAGTSSLNSGSSIVVTGSNLTATGDLNLNANNNAIVTNEVNSSYFHTESTKTGSTRKVKSTQTDYVETAVSSNLNGENINVNAGNSILVQGSNLNSSFNTGTNIGGNTTLAANNDTIITNAVLQEYHNTTKETSSRGAFKGLTAVTSGLIDILALPTNLAIAIASPILKNIDDPLQKVLDPIVPDKIADRIDFDYARNKYKDTIYDHQYHDTKSRSLADNTKTNIVASNVIAGNNLTISSTDSTTIQASNLQSGAADTNNTNGAVTGELTINSTDLNISAATSYNVNSLQQRTGRTMTVKDNISGNSSTDITNATLTAKNNDFTYNVTNQASIKAKDLDNPLIATPSYLVAIRNQLAPSNISETNLAIANNSWEQTNRQLTETGQATIAIAIVAAVIVITAVTAGAGAAPAAAAGSAAAGGGAAAGAGAGAAAAGTAAAAGGATVATGATVAAGAGVGAGAAAGAAAGGFTLAGAATVVGTAAATTALTTATISATNASMNSDGDFFKQAKSISKTTWDDTTSKDSMEQIGIAAATALLTYGTTQGLNSATNGAISAGNAPNATLTQRATTALAESAISTTTSTAVQSAINGDSFTEALANQGKNILIGAVANLGAKQIGSMAHGSLTQNSDGTLTYDAPTIGKGTQYALHATLGCAMGAAGGGDCASGAVSGVTGEFTAETIGKNTNLNNGMIKEISGLTGGLSAIFAGNAVGLDDHEVAQNIFSGQRIGKNAAENNFIQGEMMDKEVQLMWLEGKISDSEYQQYQQVRNQGERIAGTVALAAVTLGAGSLAIQGSAAAGEGLLAAKLAGATVNGIAGASGGAWGAYVGGADTKQILNSAGTAGLISAGASFMFSGSSLVNGVTVGAGSGLASSLRNTYITNPNPTGIQLLNNGIEGTLGGAIVGLTGAAFTPANSGLFGQIIGAQTALPVDMFIGAIGNKYDLFPTPRVSSNNSNQQ